MDGMGNAWSSKEVGLKDSWAVDRAARQRGQRGKRTMDSCDNGQ
jgi:hypothetical protein